MPSKFNVNTEYVQTILKGLEQMQKEARSQAGAEAEELTDFLRVAGFVKSNSAISSTLSRLYQFGHVDRIKDTASGHRFLYSTRSQKHSTLRSLNKRIVVPNEVQEVTPTLDLTSFIKLLEQHEKYKEALTNIAKILKELGIENNMTKESLSQV